jgi:transposase
MITSPYAPDLRALRAWLEQMVTAMKLVELVLAVVALVSRMSEINGELAKQVASSRRARPKSETLERLERQLTLDLDEAANPSDNPVVDREPKRRRGGHGGRKKPPENLPRVMVSNRVPPDLRVCPLCGSMMTTVGHSMCEILDVIPAQVVVLQRMDERVACPYDDTIVSAPTPPEIVERGKLGPRLLVEATADKYLEQLPVERQCTRYARSGAPIAPQTLGRGVASTIDLLAPIGRAIEEQTRAPGLLGTDWTGLPILDPGARDGIRTGSIACWTNARWVTFFYSPTGDSDSVRRFLGPDLARTVQCDGTSLTTFIERSGGKRPGCWSHARRGLVEAARAGDRLALDGLRMIAELFKIERESTLAGDHAETRKERRLESSVPVLEKIRAWVVEQRDVIPPKTPLGRALGYLHRQWPRLVLFLEDGNIELTNNRRERELRRLVIGRKNWLFAWDDVGGERTATILTILATAIAHEIDPRAYLHRVVQLLLGAWPQSRLRDLLPDRIVALHPELRILEAPSRPAQPTAIPSAPFADDY